MEKSPISTLHELSHEKKIKPPIWQMSHFGTDPSKPFKCTVEFDGKTSDGTGRSKKDAKNNAAINMMKLCQVEDQGLPVSDTPAERRTSIQSQDCHAISASLSDAEAPSTSREPEPQSKSSHISYKQSFKLGKSAIATVYELCKEMKVKPPSWQMSDFGPDPLRPFTCTVKFNGNISTGTGRYRKEAKETAAFNMLQLCRGLPSTSAETTTGRSQSSTRSSELSQDCNAILAPSIDVDIAACNLQEEDSLTKRELNVHAQPSHFPPRQRSQLENLSITTLYQLSTKRKISTPIWRMSNFGSDASEAFTCTVEFDGKTTTGTGRCKKDAKKNAAFNMLKLYPVDSHRPSSSDTPSEKAHSSEASGYGQSKEEAKQHAAKKRDTKLKEGDIDQSNKAVETYMAIKQKVASEAKEKKLPTVSLPTCSEVPKITNWEELKAYMTTQGWKYSIFVVRDSSPVALSLRINDYTLLNYGDTEEEVYEKLVEEFLEMVERLHFDFNVPMLSGVLDGSYEAV